MLDPNQQNDEELRNYACQLYANWIETGDPISSKQLLHEQGRYKNNRRLAPEQLDLILRLRTLATGKSKARRKRKGEADALPRIAGFPELTGSYWVAFSEDIRDAVQEALRLTPIALMYAGATPFIEDEDVVAIWTLRGWNIHQEPIAMFFSDRLCAFGNSPPAALQTNYQRHVVLPDEMTSELTCFGPMSIPPKVIAEVEQ